MHPEYVYYDIDPQEPPHIETQSFDLRDLLKSTEPEIHSLLVNIMPWIWKHKKKKKKKPKPKQYKRKEQRTGKYNPMTKPPCHTCKRAGNLPCYLMPNFTKSLYGLFKYDGDNQIICDDYLRRIIMDIDSYTKTINETLKSYNAKGALTICLYDAKNAMDGHKIVLMSDEYCPFILDVLLNMLLHAFLEKTFNIDLGEMKRTDLLPPIPIKNQHNN